MPMMGVPYAVEVAQKVGLIALLLVALSQLRIDAPWFGPRARQARLGLIMGVILLIAMSYPIHLPSGTQVYGGASFVGVVGFLGGPLATAITLILVVPYRLWLGGPFVATGVTFLLLIAALSLAYRRAVALWSERVSYTHLPFLSLIVSLSTLAALSQVSPMQRTMILRELGYSFAAGTFLAVWLLGALLLHQQRREERDDALGEARELLAAVTGGFPGILYRRVLLPDGALRYTYLSGAVGAMLGVDARELLADPRVAEELVHPEDRATVSEALRGAAETLSPAAITHRVLRRDGRMRWVRDLAQPHRLAGGAVAWDGCMIDVTETVRSEQALRDSEARTDTVLDLLRDAYVAANAQDRIIAWNDAAQMLFGWSREEAMGRPLGELLIPERYRDAHHRWLARLAERGGRGTVQDRHAQIALLDREGGEIPVEYGFAVLQTGQGWTYHAVLHAVAEPVAERAAERRTAAS